jgi:nucleoside-diphosphate-sugar epimerase
MTLRHPSSVPAIPLTDLQRTFELVPESTWRALSGRRLFLTGGTGFVGKWLIATLAEADRRLGLDCQLTVLSRNPSAFAGEWPELAASVRLVQGDVRDFEFPDGEHDTVIHAATDVVQSNAPEDTFSTCVEGTRRVLAYAERCRARDFLLVSSGATYGRQPADMVCIPETYAGAPDTLLASSAYGQGKRAAEWLASATQARSPLKVRIARCFAFVGPLLPLDKHFAIGNFLKAALAGEDIIIRGDGTPCRSYLYAADMAAWLWTVLLKGRAGAAYNVGAEETVSINELAHRILDVLHISVLVRTLGTPNSANPVERYVPDNGLIRRELALPAPLPLEEAIRRTAAWWLNGQAF